MRGHFHPFLAALVLAAAAVLIHAADPPLRAVGPAGGYGTPPADTAKPAPSVVPPANTTGVPAAAQPAGGGFIRVVNGGFVDADCNSWWPSGWNQ
jgi:hypothetical protein